MGKLWNDGSLRPWKSALAGLEMAPSVIKMAQIRLFMYSLIPYSLTLLLSFTRLLTLSLSHVLTLALSHSFTLSPSHRSLSQSLSLSLSHYQATKRFSLGSVSDVVTLKIHELRPGASCGSAVLCDALCVLF